MHAGHCNELPNCLSALAGIGKCVCHQGGSFAAQVSVKTLGWRVSESTASTAMSLKNPNASVHKHG